MNEQERLRRASPARTGPNRGVLGAFNQRDGARGASRREPPGHPLGPGFAESAGPEEWRGEEADEEWRAFLDDGVSAASDVVDRHIAQGREAAARLNASPLSSAAQAATDLPALLGRILRAYSDAGALWVELVSAVAQNAGKEKPFAQAAGASSAAASAPFGLSVSAAGRSEASVEMFRPAAAVSPQPLLPQGGGEAIASVRFEPGEGGGRGTLRIEAPEGAAPGVYHGLLLGADGGAPVGAVTLRLGGGA